MKSFQKNILEWYYLNKRELPWRKNNNAYHIWLSEIILQQTRVAQGLPYFEKFIDNFPKIEDLASATEEKVLQLWQGLGYYSRGRNLHFTAKHIVNELNNEFPSNYVAIQKLKGVGKYTAAAIASFAFNEKVAVLDGNVMRVLTRYYGIENDISNNKTVNELRKLANELLPSANHSDYNQGIMEFGALQCTPKKTDCNNCPLIKKCVAYNNNLVSRLPIKLKKVKVKKRFFNYLVIKNRKDIVINKRVKKDIWLNLYDFPLIESDSLIDVGEKQFTTYIDDNIGNKGYTISISEDFKHLLTHQIIQARFFIIEFNQETINIKSNLKVVKINSLDKLGKPILIQNFLNKYIF